MTKPKPDPKLTELNDPVRSRAASFLALAHSAGYGKLVIVEGYRSAARQAELYGHGRSRWALRLVNINPDYAKPKLPQVTWVTPAKAMHCRRLALDINISAYPSDHWDKIGRLGERAGLTWGGRWRCRDFGHFEA